MFLFHTICTLRITSNSLDVPLSSCSNLSKQCVKFLSCIHGCLHHHCLSLDSPKLVVWSDCYICTASTCNPLSRPKWGCHRHVPLYTVQGLNLFRLPTLTQIDTILILHLFSFELVQFIWYPDFRGNKTEAALGSYVPSNANVKDVCFGHTKSCQDFMGYLYTFKEDTCQL